MKARKPAARKFSSLMSEKLLRALQEQADRNGQSFRFLLEKAVEHYLTVVVPSAQTAHPDIVARGRKAIQRHDNLLHLLAKAE
jgi:hypothetical protein